MVLSRGDQQGLTVTREIDYPTRQFDSNSQTVAGLLTWGGAEAGYGMELSKIPNYANFIQMYREYKIDKIVIEYVVSHNTDQPYSRVFPNAEPLPAGDSTGTQSATTGVNSKEQLLELRNMNYYGHVTKPTSWAACTILAGQTCDASKGAKLRANVPPQIVEIIEDNTITDSTKTRSPGWLSTDYSAISHLMPYVAVHSRNGVSPDSATPVNVFSRVWTTVSFRGLKV